MLGMWVILPCVGATVPFIGIVPVLMAITEDVDIDVVALSDGRVFGASPLSDAVGIDAVGV